MLKKLLSFGLIVILTVFKMSYAQTFPTLDTALKALITYCGSDDKALLEANNLASVLKQKNQLSEIDITPTYKVIVVRKIKCNTSDSEINFLFEKQATQNFYKEISATNDEKGFPRTGNFILKDNKLSFTATYHSEKCDGLIRNFQWSINTSKLKMTSMSTFNDFCK